MDEQTEVNADLKKQKFIFIQDEAHFHRNRFANKQNYSILTNEDSRAIKKPIHPQRITA